MYNEYDVYLWWVWLQGERGLPGIPGFPGREGPPVSAFSSLWTWEMWIVDITLNHYVIWHSCFFFICVFLLPRDCVVSQDRRQVFLWTTCCTTRSIATPALPPFLIWLYWLYLFVCFGKISNVVWSGLVIYEVTEII